MIRYFLLQNKQGKTRLSKWYLTPPDDMERVKLEADVHRIISMRGRGYTNFVEVRNAMHIYWKNIIMCCFAVTDIVKIKYN